MFRPSPSDSYDDLLHGVRGRSLASLFLVLLFLVLLFSPASTNVFAAETDGIRISSRLDPNAILITEVDVVFVYDQQTAEEFPATKSQWYSGKFIYSRHIGDKAEIVNTFVPQGFDHLDLTLPERSREAIKIFVVAQHDDSEAVPVEISKLKNALIEIDQFGILVSEIFPD